MRVLVISGAAHGHFYPLVPVMRALATAGHEVLVAVPADFVNEVCAEGFAAHGVAAQARTATERLAARRHHETLPARERMPATTADFVREAADGLVELDALCETFVPDVILRDLMSFAGWVLAARRGCPAVVLDFFPVPPEMWAAAGAGHLHALRREAGLEPDPELATLAGDLTLVCGPASWFSYMPPSGRLLRPSDAIGDAQQAAPAWLDDLEPPVVYATLGTTFNGEPGLWTMVLDGLQRTGVSVVATVGADTDPGSLGPCPSHMRIERFVPQRLVLGHCSAAVTHGGYGSLMGCLARGIPIVSVPVAAGDNVPNALRLAGLGAGIAVLPKERSAARIAEAVTATLDDPAYRGRARAIAAEIAALPPVEEAVGWMETISRSAERS